MVTLSRSQHVSLAYKVGDLPLGGNWRIEIGGACAERDLNLPLDQIKSLLDHRCLFTDLPEFLAKPSTLENVTEFLGEKFLSDKILFLTVHENEDASCTVTNDGLLLRLRVMNLTLGFRGRPNERGLMTSRGQVTQSVIETYAEFTDALDLSEKAWAQSLFAALKRRVIGLVSVRVDLGRGKYIVVE